LPRDKQPKFDFQNKAKKIRSKPHKNGFAVENKRFLKLKTGIGDPVFGQGLIEEKGFW